MHGNVGGHATELTGSIPIKSEFAKNKYILPLRGTWHVGYAASFHTGHRWAIPEEFALDIAKVGESGLSHKATVHASMIITLMEQMCSAQQTAV